jgi:hypothetical protein
MHFPTVYDVAGGAARMNAAARASPDERRGARAAQARWR